MQPPPGSEAGVQGDPAAVGVGVAPWRSVLLWSVTGLLVLCLLGTVVLAVAAINLVPPGSASPGIALLVLLVLTGSVFLALTLLMARMAVIHRGPMLVVDDEGVRTRDLVGWVNVPWEGVTGIESQPGKPRITVTAPGRVSLNHRRLRRAALQIPTAPLLVDPDHLLTYLRHRRAVAARSGSRRAGRA